MAPTGRCATDSDRMSSIFQGIATAALQSTESYLKFLEDGGGGKERHDARRRDQEPKETKFLGSTYWVYQFDTSPYARFSADTRVLFIPSDEPDKLISAMSKAGQGIGDERNKVTSSH